MSVFSISYDLNTPGKDYSGLYEAIKKLGDHKHPLDSNWFVATILDAENIYSQLHPHIDTNDFIIVHKMIPEYSGWMKKTFWEWLRANM